MFQTPSWCPGVTYIRKADVIVASVQTAATCRLPSQCRSLPSASGIHPVRQCAIPTRSRKGIGGCIVSSWRIGRAMTVRLGQKASAFWGAPPPSCAQVSGSVPFGWCLGHGIYFSHSDNGAMAEIILVPLLVCFRLLGRSRPTRSVGRAWCRRTAVCPLDGHRIEKEGDSVATSLQFVLLSCLCHLDR